MTCPSYLQQQATPNNKEPSLKCNKRQAGQMFDTHIKKPLSGKFNEPFETEEPGHAGDQGQHIVGSRTFEGYVKDV